MSPLKRRRVFNGFLRRKQAYPRTFLESNFALHSEHYFIEFWNHGQGEIDARTITDWSIHNKRTAFPPASQTQQQRVETLQELLPDALVSRLGSEIIISGKEISLDSLSSLLTEKGLMEESVQLEKVEPTLVDGLNYHLKDVENSDAHQSLEAPEAQYG